MTDFHARRMDVSTPSAARLYDYYLGGKHNFPVDRAFAEQRAYPLCPFLPDLALNNRGFLGRVVRYCAEQGIRQFLDIGSGIPTVGNVHEIAHEVDPEIRVVYVDNDLQAVVTAEELLEGNATAAAVQADLREPSTILEHPTVRRLIDFTEPTALLIVAVLHFLNPDEQPHALVRSYLDHMAPGSYFAASHITIEDAAPEASAQLQALERAYGSTSNPATLRTRAEFGGFFDGLDLVEPGITYTVDWRATGPVNTNDPARACFYAAVGRKP